MKIATTLCAVALSAGVLGGCANAAVDTATAEQQANRSYMSQVNEVMVELDEGLDSFVDAVSRDDVVNMRTQADNAYQALSRLSDIEAPEALSDVQEKYVEGANKLKEALDAYIVLYSEFSAGTADQSSYDERIASIQALYDEGVKLLEEGDSAAAGKS